MKKVYKILLIYTFIMALGIFVSKHVYRVEYSNPNFIKMILPFLSVLTIFSLIIYNKYRVDIDTDKSNCIIVNCLFAVLLSIAIFTIYKKFSFSTSFFVPLIGAILVGISEELIYRGVVFTNLHKEKGFTKALIISASAFSLLHAVNILGGLAFNQVLSQLISTFVAGLFFATVYKYTKNILLIVIYHATWDYVLLSGISKQHLIVQILFLIFVLVEIIITFVLFKRIKK
ncbi:CPBP family intramembrane metalloprotease [Helcococcus ovis]|uniref:CPBP family intramembrane metalloprotease n=1 Tax=Helcococcus ovis TaxID=72026 RepID=A0A4V6QJ09_9FIRM|nr:CPBP family intramembrane glutamic endopeptidase [Helcococcus ovis]TFF64514.1 CPBP family intramembrane metalloprotease [Helcococcus ovis]TFF64940.1 CPBP family intramembrane metalloprotease [Helcococcus ovis]